MRSDVASLAAGGDEDIVRLTCFAPMRVVLDAGVAAFNDAAMAVAILESESIFAPNADRLSEECATETALSAAREGSPANLRGHHVARVGRVPVGVRIIRG